MSKSSSKLVKSTPKQAKKNLEKAEKQERMVFKVTAVKEPPSKAVKPKAKKVKQTIPRDKSTRPGVKNKTGAGKPAESKRKSSTKPGGQKGALSSTSRRESVQKRPTAGKTAARSSPKTKAKKRTPK